MDLILIQAKQKNLCNLLVDLVNKYNVSPKSVTEFTEVPSYEYFIKNDGLFIRGWPTYDKDFTEQPFDQSKQNNLRKAQFTILQIWSSNLDYGRMEYYDFKILN